MDTRKKLEQLTKQELLKLSEVLIYQIEKLERELYRINIIVNDIEYHNEIDEFYICKAKRHVEIEKQILKDIKEHNERERNKKNEN